MKTSHLSRADHNGVAVALPSGMDQHAWGWSPKLYLFEACLNASAPCDIFGAARKWSELRRPDGRGPHRAMARHWFLPAQ